MIKIDTVNQQKNSKIRSKLTFAVIFLTSFQFNAQHEWDVFKVPADAGTGNKWVLQTDVSDDFNYTFEATNEDADFGPKNAAPKWSNFFHNKWAGPGPTIWSRDHVAVKNGYLSIWASRNKDEVKTFNGNVTRPATRSGCITSKKRVLFPVFIESRIRVMNSSLASDVWLLSADDTQEIDILEAYGGPGDDGRNAFFAERIHLSHHVFVRPPNFKDYQPKDLNSWYHEKGVNKWGGRTIRIGVYWKNETTLEYYIDGELVRTLDDKIFINKNLDGKLEYSYPAEIENGKLAKAKSGYQKVHTISSLSEAKRVSKTSVIDPFDYLKNGQKFTKEMDIILNIEDQSWQAISNRSPNAAEINRLDDNTLLVDWIRVYKPVKSL